jgi:type III restriction enzyme
VTNRYFEAPILNYPCAYPARHPELDAHGHPRRVDRAPARSADSAFFEAPILKLKEQAGRPRQDEIVFEEGEDLSTQEQQYAHTAILNGVREHVDKWRRLPNPNDRRVTPETARLLQHWRHHRFSTFRPFFYQAEAVETARTSPPRTRGSSSFVYVRPADSFSLTEVAPHAGKAEKVFLEHLENANKDANPELLRLALKLATGAGKTTVMAAPQAFPRLVRGRDRRVHAQTRPGVNLGVIAHMNT